MHYAEEVKKQGKEDQASVKTDFDIFRRLSCRAKKPPNSSKSAKTLTKVFFSLVFVPAKRNPDKLAKTRFFSC